MADRKSLWNVINDWYGSHDDGYAALIRAMADWLVPEEPEPPLGVVPKSQINKAIDEHSEWREWFVRDCLRAELLAEADRAEAGTD